MGFLSPLSSGGARPPVFLSIIVDDVNQVYRRALEAGATSLREPADQFYGERTAQIQDPFGHVWALATPTEELSDAEIQSRFQKLIS
jgi:PhnB protein